MDIANLTDLLAALVRIPSPNPPGDTRAIMNYIADYCAAFGADVHPYAPDAKPEAASIIACIGQGDPVIMLHAHIDTVPIGDEDAQRWSSDPYAAEVRDGRLYGKGSIDDKAPLVAMLAVMHGLARTLTHGTLILVAAAEEEVGGQLGTRWLADNGFLPQCDFIVVGEQTGNQVATAHKGVVRATVRATGRSVHATNPDRGVNAIVVMARAVLALDEYHKALQRRFHPLAGSPTCNVGVIHGGSTANAVPDSCIIQLDRRMIPHENANAVQQELHTVIARIETGAATLSVGDFLVSNWFESTLNTPLSKRFCESIRAVTARDPGPVGYLPGSDAKHLTGLLTERGGEMVIFGPGSYEVAHAADEYTDLNELKATYDILNHFLHHAFKVDGP